MFLDLALCTQLVLNNKNMILCLLCARDHSRDFPGINWYDLMNNPEREIAAVIFSQTRHPEAQGPCQHVTCL